MRTTAVGGLLDHDIGELGRVGQAAERAHRDLEGELVGHRRRIEHARGDLDVLALQRVGDVERGQVQRLQPVGIEPDLHRIVAGAEDGDGADAVDAGQQILDLDVGVVGHEQRVARLVRRVEVHRQQDVGRALHHRDADLLHLLRQPRQRGRDPVLHLHLGDIEIGADVEGDRDGEAAVGGGVRGDVEHPLGAVDLLLDRRRHRVGHRLGAGAGKLAGDVDHRRGDLGILRDRQAREGDAAEDHEDERDHGGEDRAVDEEMRDAHGRGSAGVGLRLGGIGRRRALLLRRDLLAGAHPRDAVDHHLVVRARARP